MKLVLIGYMASGKSVVAKYIAKEMHIDVVDLDTYIEDKEKQTIQEIFKNKGEIYFRIKENFYLKELLLSDKNFILATGGGTPCYANNMEIIKKNSNSVYLKASIQIIYDRLIREKQKRPLVSNIENTDLKEFIAKHLFERNPFYNKADKIVSVDNKTIDEIANEIIQEFYVK